MNARELVMQRLSVEVRRFPELDLSPLNTAQLDDRDASLALAIDQALRRHWLTLVRVIESQLTRPWVQVEPKLQCALLAGAVQLLFLDRLPDHAVINETVEWAKQNVRPNAGGMVNAVLRKVAALRGESHPLKSANPLAQTDLPRSDGRVITLTESLFAEAPVTRLAQQTSHPEPLIARWLQAFGESATTSLTLHSLVQPPVIVSSANPDIAQLHSELTPHEQAGFFVFQGNHSALLALLRADPSMIVHDPTSAAPILAMREANLQPQTIVDACAGKGTKTKLLARLFPQANIIASDIDIDRLTALRSAFAAHSRVKVMEFAELLKLREQADLLLLDVPCSNTGVLARRVEAKYRYSAKTIEKIVALQRQILADTILLLTPKGRILYATCSVDEAENQQQAQWLAQWHRMKIVRERTTMPAGLPGDSPANYQDGGYWALLHR